MDEHAVFNSVKCEATLGILSGYDNDPTDVSYNNIRSFILSDMEMWNDVHGWSISWVFIPSKVLYIQEWGGMPGGEPTMTLQSIFNPYYDNEPSKEKWISRCTEYLEHLMSVFSQTTMTYTFTDCKLHFNRHIDHQKQ